MLVLHLSKREVMYLAAGKVAIRPIHFQALVNYIGHRTLQMVDSRTGEVKAEFGKYWSAFTIAVRAINELQRRRHMTVPDSKTRKTVILNMYP